MRDAGLREVLCDVLYHCCLWVFDGCADCRGDCAEVWGEVLGSGFVYGGLLCGCFGGFWGREGVCGGVEGLGQVLSGIVRSVDGYFWQAASLTAEEYQQGLRGFICGHTMRDTLQLEQKIYEFGVKIQVILSASHRR